MAIHDRLLCLEGTAELHHSEADGSVITLSVPASRHLACVIL
jgi:hypothetical protein